MVLFRNLEASSLLLFLAAQCALTACGRTEQDSATHPAPVAPTEPRAPIGAIPPVRPRWLSMVIGTGLSVVRFDDVRNPQIISVWPDEDPLRFKGISWSPGGSHLLFWVAGQTQETALPQYWVASSNDGFSPTRVAMQASYLEDIQWFSDEVLFASTRTNEGRAFLRIVPAHASTEDLGTLSASTHSAAFSVSKWGTLYPVGTPAAADLMFARGLETPVRVGQVNLESLDIPYAGSQSGLLDVSWASESPKDANGC